MRANLHTHTFRCKHADGDVDAYCRAALAAGLETLGISDHTPMPDGRWPSVRMDMHELPDYCQAIDGARVRFPELTILKGMECEYVPEFNAFFEEELLGRWGVEYLVCGVHWFPLNGEWTGMYGGTRTPAALRAYADFLVEAMASGLFDFVAHPDLFGNAYPHWDSEAAECSRRILEAAECLGVPLELNAYGFLKRRVRSAAGPRFMYPWEPFWELAAEYDIDVVVSSDAHRPRNIVAETDLCLDIADRCGLKVISVPPRLKTVLEAIG
jgi:histidinol-phosphatase (PHP family)